MFYLAVLCIALGLLCLLYLGFTMSGRREEAVASGDEAPAPGAYPRPAQEPFRPVSRPATPEPVRAPVSHGAGARAAHHGFGAPPAVASAPPEISAPVNHPSAHRPAANRPPANRLGEVPSAPVTGRETPSKTRERTTEFRRIDTDALADTLRVYARREAAPRETEQPLIVGGILYLNNSRYLPAAAGESPAGETDFAPRAFANLRRVGQGTLVMEGGGFHIHCGNANYSYTVSDLEQIVFQDRGVALIPTRHDHAVPVFITAEPERIKNYIKKHAHIIHGRP